MGRATLLAVIVAIFAYGLISQPPVSAGEGGRGPGTAWADAVLNARLGFGGRCHPGSWAPLRVELRCHDRRAVDDQALDHAAPGVLRTPAKGTRPGQVNPGRSQAFLAMGG